MSCEVSNGRELAVDIDIKEKLKMVTNQKGGKCEKYTYNNSTVSCGVTKDRKLNVNNNIK